MVLFQRSRSSPMHLDVSYGNDDVENGGLQRSKKSKNGNKYSSSSSRKSSRSSMNYSSSDKKGSFCSKLLRTVQYLILGLIFVQCIKSHKNVQRINMELASLQIEYESTNSHLVDLEQELDSAHEDFHKLQMTLLVGQSNKHTYPAGLSEEGRKEVTDKIIQKQEHQVDRIAQLQKSIQKNYEVELTRKFGPGPYHVEFQLNVHGNKKFLTIETAPNNLMPHSVYFFMEMIERGVWDKTIFVHNAEHIISAALVGHDEEDKSHLVEERLAFNEYSHEFEHEEFSLGFADTGPEFYFNIRDNAAIHGPSGKDDADPCFAKVIIGGETMQLLKEISLDAVDKDKASEKVMVSYIEKAVIIKLPKDRVQKLKKLQ